MGEISGIEEHFDGGGANSDIEVLYDTSDPKTQWRCHMHTVTKPHFLAIFMGAPVLMIIAGMPWQVALITCLVPYLVFALVLNSTIRRRTRGSRICSTVLSADGIRDLTPDSDKMYPWKLVRNIEISSGDIYFFIPFAEIFVPRSAFEDQDAAMRFYESARNLWKGSRQLIGETRPLRLADLEAEEEAKWKQFEEDHKKSKESAKHDSE
jgi:hypothetical protein